MKHLHFGAGHFGLGFVCLLAYLAGLRSVIVNRRSPPLAPKQPGDEINAHRRNELLQASNYYAVRYLLAPHMLKLPNIKRFDLPEFERFVFLEDIVGDIGFTQRYVVPESLLITTSLASEEPYPIVARVALNIAIERKKARIQKPCYIVACENKQNTRNIEDAIRHEIAERDAFPQLDELNIVPLEASVDRVCVSIMETESTVQIDAEPFARLFLQSSAHDQELRERFSSISSVVFFTEDIEIEKKKKYWILNGAHAFVSINALYFRAAFIDQYLTQDEIDTDLEAFGHYSEKYLSLSQRRLECRQILDELCDAFECFLQQSPRGIAYLAKDFTPDKRQVYIDEIIERFSNTHDYVGRVLKTFVKPSHDKLESLNIFFERTNPKILEPIKLYMKSKNTAPVAIMQSMLRLFELIAAGDDIDRILAARHSRQ